MSSTPPSLIDLFSILFKRFGPQHWWPAESKLEMVVGAILTQNTAWKNVEVAVKALKSQNLLSISALENINVTVLERIIKSAGFYRQKAKRIKEFIKIIETEYDHNLDMLLKQDKDKLKEILLHVNGIGKETADSILLYAANYPFFIVDSYTLRILKRMGYNIKKMDYDSVQQWLSTQLPEDTELFKEYHALLVQLAKTYCKKKPICAECPVNKYCQKNF